MWNIKDEALQGKADVSILKRCNSSREVFDHLEKWYDPEMTSFITSKFPLTSSPLRHCMH